MLTCGEVASDLYDEAEQPVSWCGRDVARLLESAPDRDIPPQRLRILEKDGAAWLLGSGGFGQVLTCMQHHF